MDNKIELNWIENLNWIDRIHNGDSGWAMGGGGSIR